jgi:hypothetical protein
MTVGFTVSAGWDLPVGDNSQVHAAVAMAGAAATHARLEHDQLHFGGVGGATRVDDTAVVVVSGAARETRS